MPKILDYGTFCENLEEITSTKTIGKKKFHPEGLFSEQIFGPVKNYTCQCGTYFGVSKSGGKCDLCKVDITNSDVRRTRFAKITLPMKVVNPLFYDLLVDLGGKSFKSALDELMKHEKSVLFMDGDEHVVTVTPESLPQGTQTWDKTNAIEKIVTDIANKMADEGVEEWQMIKANLNNLFLDKIIVLPPDLRPTSKSAGNKQLMDKINRYYVQILAKKEAMRETTLNIATDKNIYYSYFKQLQAVVNELYDQILAKMAKKEGLIRGNILGKRIDFSGRAVISPDPTLNLDECVLPYLMVLEIFKLPVARKIIQLGKFKLLNKALDFVNMCIDTQSPVLFRVCEEIVKDEVCILNRQPSLHRLGMLGFKIKISLDQVIKIHPLVCNPFNADFDGDQMAVYIPVSDEAKKEVIEKMLITKNLSSPANETLTTIPSQDIILGIYFLTTDQFKDVDGHKIFNDCLPEDFPKVTGPVDKKKLLLILNIIKDNYPEEKVREVLDEIKKIGFKYSTLYGCTLSLEDFNERELRPMRDTIYREGSIRDQLVKVSSPEIINELKKVFKYSYMIESGARGTWDQVKQLILTRGFISNFDGEILPLPIKHNLVEGLDEQEFFYSTFGCRKGLLDVALNTGTSGYLSRKLIFTCANLQINSELDDCGTVDTLAVNVKNERKAAMLINRYALANDGKSFYKITKENYRELVGKFIHIRSPILCTSPKICKTCYGDLHKTINSRFIGIIAAQTLGERATQLVLRTFHTSGSAIIKGAEDNLYNQMRQQDIIGDLTTVASLLHKFKSKTYVDIVDELFDAYSADIYHVHFECVVAQLMWNNYKKWRLLKDRDKIIPNYYSVQSVPNQESWILAMAFSNPKRSILQGILYEGRYSGVMDKILKGERLE
jgi:DNA-directed RNA polymerase subunit beta'